MRRLKTKRLSRPAALQPHLHRANQQWALDFASDALGTGRGTSVLAIVDAFTRECLSLEVDTGLSSERVTRALERILERLALRKAFVQITVAGSPRAISSPGAKNARSNAYTYNRASPPRTLISKALMAGYECLNATWFRKPRTCQI